jgi:hypothetical protein
MSSRAKNNRSRLVGIYSHGTRHVDQNSLTHDQIETQNRADAVVSNVLFKHELDEAVSYNIHKDGFLVVRFAQSVPTQKYTEVVDILRSSPDIRGVRAEQGGREVCALPGR